MGITSFDKGKAEGVAIGQRLSILLLLERRFGSDSFQVRERVESWPPDQLAALFNRCYEARSLKELGLED